MTDNKVDEKTLALLKAVKANDVEAVKAQLENGSSPDSRKSPAKKNALMIAASRGYSDVIAVLLNAGAKTSPTEMLMNSALHFACIAGVVRSVELIIETGCELNKPNAFHKTPLMVAIMHNRLEVVKLLLNKDPLLRVGFLYSDDSELTLACQQSDLRIATYLLDNFKPIVGIKNELQIALLRAVVQHRPDVLNLLSGYGADIDYMDMFLDPPIFTAIRAKDPMILQYVLDLGADVNKKCFGGDTPLLFAISHDNETGVRMLIKKGATVDEEAARTRLEELRIETNKRLESMITAVEVVIRDAKKSNGGKKGESKEKQAGAQTEERTKEQTKEQTEEQTEEKNVEQTEEQQEEHSGESKVEKQNYEQKEEEDADGNAEKDDANEDKQNDKEGKEKE
ncbi:unnamed protein product [Hymenolepis diminuta]|uniref:Uncharacterized protein n=1 Tax=Hymenolepis diminuta TaxID=6216 RepID=A0A564Z1Z0_HYMDI|nr:unnamed protein product [Hymenolepis diminuta]